MTKQYIQSVLSDIKYKGNSDLASDLVKFLAVAKEIFSLDNTAFCVYGCCKEIDGIFMQELVLHSGPGEYRFSIPTHCAYYTAFRRVFEPEFQPVKVGETFTDSAGNKFVIKALRQNSIKREDGAVENSLICQALPVVNAIEKAAKFLGKSQFHKYVEFVWLHIQDGNLQILGSDGATLYVSEQMSCECKYSTETKVMFAYNAHIRQLIKDCTDTAMRIDVYENTVVFTPVDGKTYEASRYASAMPGYQNIIPVYEQYMEFDKKKFLATLKMAELGANKTAKNVKLHLNGQIDFSAQEIVKVGKTVCDHKECTYSMPYISKSFPDMDISFNAGMLRRCVSVFKDKKIRLFSAGNGEMPSVIQSENSKDFALIMPYIPKKETEPEMTA